MPLPPLIPRQVLFGNPERAAAQVSPDGSRLSFLAPVDGVLNVWVGPRGGDAFRPVTQDRDRGIRGYHWAHDGRHILFLQDTGGDENWRLFAVDLQTLAQRPLTPFDGVQVQLIEHVKHFPDVVILGMNQTDPRLHDAYRLHLPTGRLNLVARNPGNVVGWLTDAQLHVRGAMATNDQAGLDLLVRASPDAEWHTAARWHAEDALTSGPVAFARNGRSVLLRDSTDANAAALVRLDLADHRRTVLARDPMYDAAEVMIHPDTYEAQLVSFMRERREWQVLDASIAADVAAVAALADGDFVVYGRNDADDLWVVGFTEDDAPSSYYLYARDRRQGTFLFSARPALEHHTLAPMRPISFAARDGVPLHAYLTCPVGVTPRGLPLVLNVHGGPWHRDVWGYDPEAQWLANRGYACLQVNFRGSTGYGKRFLNAGDREWGGKMQDDLVDAVNWAVTQGIADRERIAIYGGSYGGYAALMGTTLTPDLFRCAVSIVGPSNLMTFIQSIPPYWSSYLSLLHRRVGHPEADAEFLRSRSPLTHVDRIRTPLLIAQGANDPRVKRGESEQIVAALRDRGVEHEYLVFEDEGHGFAKPANRLTFYATAERFLARHLGGRRED
ncbi:MAG TPA: S9 family peptidase [Gemmatimonadales bacterium]|nr:S9 family peptidase [Gemmatimonadales bacterium]